MDISSFYFKLSFSEKMSFNTSDLKGGKFVKDENDDWVFINTSTNNQRGSNDRPYSYSSTTTFFSGSSTSSSNASSSSSDSNYTIHHVNKPLGLKTDIKEIKKTSHYADSINLLAKERCFSNSPTLTKRIASLYSDSEVKTTNSKLNQDSNNSSKSISSIYGNSNNNSRFYVNEDSTRIPYTSQTNKEESNNNTALKSNKQESTSYTPVYALRNYSTSVKSKNENEEIVRMSYNVLHMSESNRNKTSSNYDTRSEVSRTVHYTNSDDNPSLQRKSLAVRELRNRIHSNQDLAEDRKSTLSRGTHSTYSSSNRFSMAGVLRRTSSIKKVVKVERTIDHLIKHFEGSQGLLYQFFFEERPPEIVLPDRTVPIPQPQVKGQDKWSVKEEYEEAKEVLPDEQKAKVETNKSHVIKDLVEPLNSSRLLWCQMPQVISSPLLNKLSKKERQLNEAKFEILSSEASYYKSLAVLELHFAWSKKLNLTKAEEGYLFRHVEKVRAVSDKVFRQVSGCFEENILMTDLPVILIHLAKDDFKCYIDICRDQPLVDKTYNELMKRPEFVKAVQELESSPKCQNLKLNSFLILPMQRALRMPLLIESVTKKLSSKDPEYKLWQEAYQLFKKIANDCNDACGKISDLEVKLKKLKTVVDSITFSPGLPPIGLFSSNRYVEMEDLFTYKCLGDVEAKHLHGEPIKLILFNDYLFLTRALGNKKFQALNYTMRDRACMFPLLSDCGYCIKLIIIDKNEEDLHCQQWVLDVTTEEKREKWLQALPPNIKGLHNLNIPEMKPFTVTTSKQGTKAENDDQVTAKYAYDPQQPDELELKVGDVIRVIENNSNGWSEGERIRDGKIGLFPANYCHKL